MHLVRVALLTYWAVVQKTAGIDFVIRPTGRVWVGISYSSAARIGVHVFFHLCRAAFSPAQSGSPHWCLNSNMRTRKRWAPAMSSCQNLERSVGPTVFVFTLLARCTPRALVFERIWVPGMASRRMTLSLCGRAETLCDGLGAPHGGVAVACLKLFRP